jgi:hypothetical protein
MVEGESRNVWAATQHRPTFFQNQRKRLISRIWKRESCSKDLGWAAWGRLGPLGAVSTERRRAPGLPGDYPLSFGGAGHFAIVFGRFLAHFKGIESIIW